jgi:hypothetical protein
MAEALPLSYWEGAAAVAESTRAELDDRELAALIEATNNVPQTAPGLLAWIDALAQHEACVEPMPATMKSTASSGTPTDSAMARRRRG